MKIIHARKRVWEKDNAFKQKMPLLVWVLSILKWKEFGYTVKLYCDKPTLEDIEKFGFETLYDEVDSEYLSDKDVCKGIDFAYFWAMPKLLALRNEVVNLGFSAVVTDQDVVPMGDVSRLWKNTDVAVWSNKEYTEIQSVYPKKYKLSLPKGYELPKWFTGNAKPLNTGILHIKNREICDFYTKEVLNMVVDNENEKNNTNCQTMCNAEQRLLGEVVKYKDLSYSVMQPINEGLFNKNGFHTHGYKSIVKNHNGLNWHINLLLMIKKLDINMYTKLIENPFFKEEREFLNAGLKYTKLEELKIYKDIF